MLVTSALESIVWSGNCDDTAGIVYQLDQRLSEILHVGSNDESHSGMMEIYDGCDFAVLFIAKDGSVQFSSGNTPVFVCDGKEVMQYKGQKLFIGEGRLRGDEAVNVQYIPPNPGNKFYIASDGLFSQIGRAADGNQGIQFGYFVQTCNTIKKESIALIQSRIDHLNTLGKQELRILHRKKLMEDDDNPDSKGAGLGLIEIARRATAPIQYEFEEIDDNTVYFTLYVEIDRNADFKANNGEGDN